MHIHMLKGFAVFDNGELLGASATIDGVMTLIRTKIEGDLIDDEAVESTTQLQVERTTVVLGDIAANRKG
jgi:hypothetical protein